MVNFYFRKILNYQFFWLSQVLLSNFSHISEMSRIALMRESMSHFTTPPFPSVEAFEMGQFELRQIKEIISQ